MTTVDRTQVSEPVLRQEEVPVAAIGGAVIVRGLLLADRLEMWTEVQPKDSAETPEQAAKRAADTVVERHLARSVVLDDGQPLWTAEQWKAFGQKHPEDAFTLYNLSTSFSGGDTKAIEKN